MDILRKGISVAVGGGRESIAFDSEQQFSAVTVQVLLLGRDGWKAWLKFLDRMLVKATPCDRSGELFAFRISGHRLALESVVSHKYVKSVEWIEATVPHGSTQVAADPGRERYVAPLAITPNLPEAIRPEVELVKRRYVCRD